MFGEAGDNDIGPQRIPTTPNSQQIIILAAIIETCSYIS